MKRNSQKDYCPFFLLLIFACLFFSCVKDKPNPENNIIPNSTHKGIVLCNEGAFGNSNAELSFLDLDENKVYNALFQTANNKRLGDIAQSITRLGDKYYITINTSNKVVILDTATFQELGVITNIQSPRYITQVNATKAYISSLYFPAVYVINYKTNTVIKTIVTDKINTEQMLIKDGYCYITNWDTSSNYIYKINISNDSIESKIQLSGYASHSIVLDKHNNIWVLSGNRYKQRTSQLDCISTTTNQLIKSFTFPSAQDPFRLQINVTKDTLYYILVNYDGLNTNNGLCKMSISASDLPSAPFIQAPENTYFWAYGIDAFSQQIFLSDPKGFTQQSTLYRYTNTGILMKEYTTGIGTNYFLFK